MPSFLREPNPILVRELKQFVRNRLLLYFMLFYLAAISLVTVIVLAMPELVRGIHFLIFDFSECDGPELFAFLMMSYYFFAGAFLVLFGGVKLGFERYKNDLGYYTTVAPWRIISGKFLLGVVVSLIFLSISLPFLTIAYMMRGLDLSTVALAMLFYFFMTLVHYSVTIAFYAGARTLTRIYLFGLVLAFLQFIGFCIGLGASYTFIYYPEFMGSNFSYAAIPFSIQWAFILFPLPFAVCQVSPESSNRMMPVRICMTLFFLLTAFASIFCIWGEWSGRFTSTLMNTVSIVSTVSLICIYIFYPIIFLINICERDRYSVRQRRLVPRLGPLRFLYFLHATGVANAMLWYACFLIASIVLFFVCFVSVSATGYSDWSEIVKEVFWRVLAFAIMVYCWAVVFFTAWKFQFRNILPREWLSFPLFCFAIIVYIFYCVASLSFPYDSGEIIGVMFSIFPIVIVHEHGVMAQYFFGVTGACILTVASGEMIGNAYNALSPYDGPKVLSDSELRKAIELAANADTPEHQDEQGDLSFGEMVEPEVVE